jgi:hypothetical protein
MLIQFSPLARAVCETVDTNIKLKCVGRNNGGAYIISNKQLALAGVPLYNHVGPVDTNGKRWKDHTAIKAMFIQA